MKYTLILFCLLTFSSFGQNKEGVSCQLVKKAFIKKNGEAADFQEYYLRCSVADYFIKLCESSVTAEELDKYLNQGLPAEIEFKEGTWDICEDDPDEMQSRIGEYVIIKSLNTND